MRKYFLKISLYSISNIEKKNCAVKYGFSGDLDHI